MSDHPDCYCGHPASHHDAGECWTDTSGNEVDRYSVCPCGWYEPKAAKPEGGA
jgi:hypothetical protein